MRTERATFETRLAAPPDRVYDWHAEPSALSRLVPPGDPVEVVGRTGGFEDGARVVLRVGPRPFRRKWVAEHRYHVPGREFTDVMVAGPFRSWRHRHRFLDDGAGGTRLLDEIEYALPFGALGRLLLGRFVRRRLRRMFEWRHRQTAAALGGPPP